MLGEAIQERISLMGLVCGMNPCPYSGLDTEKDTIHVHGHIMSPYVRHAILLLISVRSTYNRVRGSHESSVGPFSNVDND